MLETTALFASTFMLVLALGLQSQFVNNGHYTMAFANSLMIGSANLVLFKLAPDASSIEIAAFICGGPFGIVTSMWLYRLVVKRKTENLREAANRPLVSITQQGIVKRSNYTPPANPPPRRRGHVPKRPPTPDPNR